MNRSIRSHLNVTDAIGSLLDDIDGAVEKIMITCDPWSADFQADAWQAINTKCAEIWPALKSLMPGQSSVYCLQQAVAARFQNRLQVGYLYRAALHNKDTIAEAERLRILVLNRWAQPRELFDPGYRAMVEFLMAPNAAATSIPNLSRHTRYRGSIRLRYSIAHACHTGAGLAVVLLTAATQPSATTYQRKVELKRAVKAAHAAGRNWRHLGELEFTLLPSPAQALLLATPEVWPHIFAQSMLAEDDLLNRAAVLIAERNRIVSVLSRMMNDIHARKLQEAEAHMAQVPDSPLGRALCTRLRDESWQLYTVKKHEALKEGAVGTWTPLSAAALQRLQGWAREPLPHWWAMTGPQIAELMTTGALDKPGSPKQLDLPQQDLALIRRTWSEEQQATLIRAGYGHVLPGSAAAWSTMQLAEVAPTLMEMAVFGLPLLARRLYALPNAQAWLEIMADAPTTEAAEALRDAAQRALETYWHDRWDNTWNRWILSSYGCDVWSKVEAVALARTCPLKDAVAFFTVDRKPLFPGGFQAAVARSLHKEEMLPPKTLHYLRAWLVRDPLAARALAEHAPVQWIERLARNAGTPVQTLDIFMSAKALPEPIRRLAWRNRLARTQDAQELAQLAARMPVGLGSFQNLSHWVLAGPSSIQAMGLVLTARRDGARLQALSNQLGPDAFRQACADGARYLLELAREEVDLKLVNRAHREAATLELLKHLGGEVAPSLLKVLALRNIEAATGCKLDHAYTEFTIAKRNGGERIIRAPELALKEVQRAMLDKLIDPLGQHEAACGFVKGKSIADNAQPHVGKAVVVNADIRNCFPSVRWPLVLGVVRRELGPVLSQAAISLVVDIVTARGALPVGAPTSPAILNLVLRKTDEVLSRQAERLGGSYTRYADDLTFSGDSPVVGLIQHAQRLIARLGLELDPNKTNVFRRGRRQMVTGLTVNDQVSVPRAIRRQLRAAVHQVEQGNAPKWEGVPEDLQALQGRLGFVSMVRPEHGVALRLRLDSALVARAAIREASSSAGLTAAAWPRASDDPKASKGATP